MVVSAHGGDVRAVGFHLSPLRSGAAMSDRLAAVNAALDAALVSDRWLEEAAIEHCQQGLVDFYVDEIAALLAIQASLRRLG